MIITVVIQNHPFEIDCDTGTQDIAWLSLCACSLYGQTTYPITTYLPILAKNQAGTILPPKLIIVKNMEMIGEKIYVDVRKKASEVNSELTEKQKEWYYDAFLEGRFKMTVNVKLKPSGDIRKDNSFKVVFDYEILPKIASFFPQYGNTIEIEMKSTSKGRKDINFEGESKIPFGKLKQKKILFCQKGTNTFDKETSDFSKNELSFTTSNELLSDEEKEKYLQKKEDLIRDKEIKIKQNNRYRIIRIKKERRNKKRSRNNRKRRNKCF